MKQAVLKKFSSMNSESGGYTHLFNSSYLELVLIFIVGFLGRSLVSKSPFCWRRVLGELLLACLLATVMWSFGMMQGMSEYQMIFIGGMASLGGVRSIQWIIKAFNAGKYTPSE
jgi:hypothetical protein